MSLILYQSAFCKVYKIQIKNVDCSCIFYHFLLRKSVHLVFKRFKIPKVLIYPDGLHVSQKVPIGLPLSLFYLQNCIIKFLPVLTTILSIVPASFTAGPLLLASLLARSSSTARVAGFAQGSAAKWGVPAFLQPSIVFYHVVCRWVEFLLTYKYNKIKLSIIS